MTIQHETRTPSEQEDLAIQLETRTPSEQEDLVTILRRWWSGLTDKGQLIVGVGTAVAVLFGLGTWAGVGPLAPKLDAKAVIACRTLHTPAPTDIYGSTSWYLTVQENAMNSSNAEIREIGYRMPTVIQLPYAPPTTLERLGDELSTACTNADWTWQS